MGLLEAVGARRVDRADEALAVEPGGDSRNASRMAAATRAAATSLSVNAKSDGPEPEMEQPSAPARSAAAFTAA